MNQTFKKKVISASIAAVFVFGAAAAQANLFAGSSTADPTKVYANTATTSTGVAISDVVITELGNTMVSGYYTITIPSTVRLAAAATAGAGTANSVIPVASLGTPSAPKKLRAGGEGAATTTDAKNVYIDMDGTAATGTQSTDYVVFTKITGNVASIIGVGDGSAAPAAAVTATQDEQVGTIYYDSTTGNTVITLGFLTAATSADVLTLKGMSLAPATASSTGTVALTLADGRAADGAFGSLVSADSSIPVMTLVNGVAGVTGTVAPAVVPTALVSAVAAQPTGVLAIKFSQAITAASDGRKFTVVLNNGAKFHSTATATLQGGSGIASAENSNLQTDLRTSANGASVAVTNGQLVITLPTGAHNIAAGDTITIPAGLAVIDSSAASAGAISATVTGSCTSCATVDLSTVSSTVEVATAAATGSTVSFVDDTVVGYKKLFTGRDGQTILEKIGIAEAAPTSLLSGGGITLTLSSGLFTAAVTPSSAANTDTATYPGTVSLTLPATTNVATYTATVSGATSASSGKGAINIGGNFSFDLTGVTAPGDLTVTVSGNAGASGSVKMAEIVNATTASVSGALPTTTASSVVTLPEIVITESAVGAVTGGGRIAVLADTAKIASFDSTGATLKALKADGTDVSATIGGMTLSNVGATSTTTSVLFTPTNNSSTSTGPITYKIAGLKATLASSASGDINVVVSGVNSATPDLGVAVNAGGNEVSSNVGGKITKATMKVAATVGATVPSVPAATVTGTITSQQISVSLVPAGNDQGKQGSVFIAAVVPASSGIGGVYFMNSSKAWTAYTSCATAPSYSTGNLAAVSGVDVLAAAADLTVLKGTQIYVGYGVGGALSPAGTACTNMLNNGTYNLSYEIK